MGSFVVEQRTKDSMFNATSLLKQWNKANPANKKEKVQLFFNNKNTKGFITTLEDDLNGQKITHLNSRGKNGGTWMHPYLFIKFAMWLNPKFELQVIKFVHDQLIEHWHRAGDNYNVLAKAVAKLPDADYRQTAIALQWLVFNTTGKDLRQNATPEQLRQLSELEKQLAFAIDMGYINTQAQLIGEMRKLYRPSMVLPVQA